MFLLLTGRVAPTRDRTIDLVGRIKRDIGIESMAHLTCVGSTVDELNGVLDRLIDTGIENVLALRGDPPKGQTTFTATEGGLNYASELVALIRSRFGSRLCVGAAAYPEKHIECGNPAVDLANLKRKVDAGVDFLVTQLFFDNRRYFEFVDNARAAGIRVPISPASCRSPMPLRSNGLRCCAVRASRSASLRNWTAGATTRRP